MRSSVVCNCDGASGFARHGLRKDACSSSTGRIVMNQGTILIVEDDTALRHSLSTMLRVLGFETFEAQSGELGLAELRNHKMELVLLDLNMPGMGGIAACEKIRAAHPRLPIIALTVR